ncbi:hypothetical protein Acr_03g0018360 [Actinidia rufa]|uniref:Uncharacterized protein n=1 Tax=Actinidia rufa TaxID=165716 RepID=A0A7J0EFD5_9ERIC|nr:hypothetical protein Acr_03g0018360 [Actinidia rufa]
MGREVRVFTMELSGWELETIGVDGVVVAMDGGKVQWTGMYGGDGGMKREGGSWPEGVLG